MATIKPSFNLADEPWIPALYNDGTGSRLVSFITLFKDLHKIVCIDAQPDVVLSVMANVRAIVDDAMKSIVFNDNDWKKTFKTFQKNVISYITERHDDFYLYHPKKPYLQDGSLTEEKATDIWRFLFPQKKKSDDSKPKTITAMPLIVLSNLPVGTASVGFSSQFSKEYSDAELALLLVTHQCIHLTDSKDARKKPKSDYSPYLQHHGGLHAFFAGSNMAETVWLNYHTNDSAISKTRGKLHLTYSDVYERSTKSYANETMPMTRRIRITEDRKILMVHGHKCDTLPDTWIRREQKKATDSPVASYNKGNHGIRYLDAACAISGNMESGTLVNWASCKNLNANIERNKKAKGFCNVSIQCIGISCETGAFGQAFTGDSNTMQTEIMWDIRYDNDAITLLHWLINTCECFDQIIYGVVGVYAKAQGVKSAKGSTQTPLMSYIDSCRRQWWAYIDTNFDTLFARSLATRNTGSESINSAIKATLNTPNMGRSVLEKIIANTLPNFAGSHKIALAQALNAYRAMINNIYIKQEGR